ncbi:MAG: hypothetical protein HUK08_02870, partial [Bacteroidaceae bacterium]|nr:hypothetical protein [Bacteroidaceae bacterium]
KVLPKGGRLSPWPYVIALCVGIVIGILVASMFSCGGGSNDTVDPSAPVAETTTEEVSSEDIAPEAEPTLAPSPIVEQTEPEEVKEEEKAEEQTVQSTSTMPDKDTEYLKKNDTWKMSDASSSEAKSLLGAFGSGNIDAIIGANAYNSLQENKRNGYYNKIVNDLKKIKRQSNVEDAKAALRDACKNGTVNLKAVQDRMHRMLK